MAKISRTWWGQRFLEALEVCTDEGRLRRGRSYAGPHRLLQFAIKDTVIAAKVRGNVNPYFGVYTEPRYQVRIQLGTIPAKAWSSIIKRLTANAGWLSRLLMNEMPDDIEAAFAGGKHHLLPDSAKDLNTDCTCPDWANPCKHVAGTYYRVAELLDRDPFLLFQLRGLSREKLQRELRKTPLGQALAAQLEQEEDTAAQISRNRYTPTPTAPLEKTLTHKAFWSGSPLPRPTDIPQAPGVAALLIKKQGDYPAFWHRNNSFIEAMEQIYEQVRLKNKDSL